jgi:uncharacterized protein with von Willebrand factor type A (vWA) domain
MARQVDRSRKMRNTPMENAEFEGYTLQQVADRIAALIATYGPTATIEEHTYPYDDEKYKYVFKNIPETDEQMNERIANEERWFAGDEERERREFERLQAKFGAK